MWGAASALLVCLNCVHFLLEDRNVWHYRDRFGDSFTHFSYDSFVTQRKWWVALTATISHASPSHLVVNLTLLMAVSWEIEAEIGAIKLLMLYFCVGITGWMVTLGNNYWRYFTSGWQWISSCGASPSTYGLAFWSVIVFPCRELPFSWVLLIIYLSTMAYSTSSKWHVHSKIQRTLCSLDAPIVTIVTSIGLYYSTDGGLNSMKFLVIYLSTTLLCRVWHLQFCGGSLEYPSADNAAHLGGAFAGIILGFCFCWGGDVGGGGSCRSEGEYLRNVVVVVCFSFLVMRCYLNL